MTTAKPAGVGLYRLRSCPDEIPGLVYIGQGAIGTRLRSHLAKAARAGSRHTRRFSGQLDASWVGVPNMPISQVLEHENDLIAAHVLVTRRPPAAQFLG